MTESGHNQDEVAATQDTGSDGSQALLDEDPQERALDELAAYLASAGVELADVADVEAQLDAEQAASDEHENALEAQPGRTRRARSRQTRSVADGQAAPDEDDDDLHITVSDDRLSATLSRLDAHTTLRRIALLLKEEKIRHGIAVNAIKELVARVRAGDALADVLVARGQPAVPGHDAVFEWAIETSGRSGTILEDGSIDLRDRRLVTMISEGGLIGRYRPERAGTNGRDVFGRAVVAARPRRLHLVPGAHVRVEHEAEECIALYAESDGGVAHEEDDAKGKRRLRVSLTNVSHIEGDVDYATGHIDFDGEVVIDGSVRALFNVRASGAVTVSGNVESGAHIEAGGDILVGGGIVGEDTRIDAGGKVMAKFLQGCQVSAGADVEIGAYVFETSLKTRGKLTVAGMGEGSGRALVGGLVWAADGCETPSLGSPSNPHIRLILGVDPRLVDEVDRLRIGLRKIEAKQAELLAELGLATFDVAKIRSLLKVVDENEQATCRPYSSTPSSAIPSSTRARNWQPLPKRSASGPKRPSCLFRARSGRDPNSGSAS